MNPHAYVARTMDGPAAICEALCDLIAHTGGTTATFMHGRTTFTVTVACGDPPPLRPVDGDSDSETS